MYACDKCGEHFKEHADIKMVQLTHRDYGDNSHIPVLNQGHELSGSELTREHDVPYLRLCPPCIDLLVEHINDFFKVSALERAGRIRANLQSEVVNKEETEK